MRGLTPGFMAAFVAELSPTARLGSNRAGAGLVAGAAIGFAASGAGLAAKGLPAGAGSAASADVPKHMAATVAITFLVFIILTPSMVVARERAQAPLQPKSRVALGRLDRKQETPPYRNDPRRH